MQVPFPPLLSGKHHVPTAQALALAERVKPLDGMAWFAITSAVAERDAWAERALAAEAKVARARD